MKLRLFLATAGLVCVSSQTFAQGATVPYNEAVHVVNGKRVVDMPPHDSRDDQVAMGVVSPASGPGISKNVRVIETPMGLMDCRMVSFYHPHACSPSSFGKVKLPREWVVKRSGQWQACTGREKPISCISLVPDGELRALPVPPME